MTREDAKELAGCVGFVAMMGLLFALFCIATPNQRSAECDAAYAEMEEAK